MQGGFLTEDDLEKYLASGEYPGTMQPSFSYDRQQSHFTTLGVGGPSLTNRCSWSGPPSYDQWVHPRMPEIQQLPSGSRPNPSCCTTIFGPDPMSEANLWTRMVSRPSLRRSQRPRNYNMQQDVLNTVRLDDSLSSESMTVVDMPNSVLKPASYTGNKPPESVQSDSKSDGKGKGIEKQSSSHTCFLPKLRLNTAWNRLRRWTTTTLRDMKSRTARLSLAARPIRWVNQHAAAQWIKFCVLSLAGRSDQHDIWRYPEEKDMLEDKRIDRC
ncbi:uncharacterized protein EDB93DRAFT_1146448 [Suillus bovinus]|uniref:uncharacterized protein n=1 Tax=Suillus bovinus TaxID=48563 RepID=UPI001B86E50F|nr:uncharacterized protein EDB93DRAFT_1146448 [Suillus bovinus]KAG2147747.1 hypothetical protein EDB93DRAFT_1146448 [Suillus bovinus]